MRTLSGKCHECNGSGTVYNNSYEMRRGKCDECYGGGYLRVVVCCATSCEASIESRRAMFSRLRVVSAGAQLGENVLAYLPGGGTSFKKTCCKCPFLRR